MCFISKNSSSRCIVACLLLLVNLIEVRSWILRKLDLSCLLYLIGPGQQQPSTSGRGDPRQPKPAFEDLAQTVVWGGRLPSRRRAITGGLTGLGIGEPMRSCSTRPLHSLAFLSGPAGLLSCVTILGMPRRCQTLPDGGPWGSDICRIMRR